MARFLNTRTKACQAVVALGKQRLVDLCDFEAILVYRASSRAAKATLRNPFSVGIGGTQNPELPRGRSPGC